MTVVAFSSQSPAPDERARLVAERDRLGEELEKAREPLNRLDTIIGAARDAENRLAGLAMTYDAMVGAAMAAGAALFATSHRPTRRGYALAD